MTPARGFSGRHPRYSRPETGSRDRWMFSYMDLVTILLILFVTIAAQKVHESQPRPVRATPPPAAAATVPVSLPAIEPPSNLTRAQERLREQGMDLRMEARGLVISLPQAVLFHSGEDQIRPDALAMVGRIARVLADVPNQVTLVGHADSVPIHNKHFRNNWELSAARGLRLLEVMTRQYGIPESRLSVASFGSYKPKSPNDTPDGRAENRRVEIVIAADPSS